MPDDFTRRQTLAALAAVGLVGCKTPQTVPPTDADADADADADTDADADADTDTDLCESPTGQQIEGPFYPGEPIERMDIREDREGVALSLDLEIVAQGSCEPLVGAEVDVWSADAVGAYSGYADFGTVGQSWLRGQQITGSDGMVRFTAVVPGSYPGRAVHLHVKVRATGRPELTTQVYLPDALVASILTAPEYVGGAPQTPNEDDDFYRPDTLLEATGDESGVTATGRLIV